MALAIVRADEHGEVAQQFNDMVRPQPPKPEPTSVPQAVADLWPLLSLAARQRDIELAQMIDDGLPDVRADVGQIQQILINLVVNALEATSHGGRVTVAVRALSREGRPGGGCRRGYGIGNRPRPPREDLRDVVYDEATRAGDRARPRDLPGYRLRARR